MSSYCLPHCWQQHIARIKEEEVPSLASLEHWRSNWWSCLFLYLLRLSWDEWRALFPFVWLDKASSASSWVWMTSYSGWMLINLWASCVSSDPITTLLAGASLSSKRGSSKRAFGKRTPWSFRSSCSNGIISVFVLINIVELILLFKSWLLIFSVASHLRKVKRLDTFAEHAHPLILSQEEVLIKLE